MQEDEKKTVDIDTSGPDVEIELPEEKKEGKKVPFYAADGVGKMKKGGIAKLNPGLKAYMMKKKKKKGKK